jgi:hypothetical protein
MHTVTQGDTQILMKANTYNKTGDLDIFSYRLSRRKLGFKSRWDHQINLRGYQFMVAPFLFVCPFSQNQDGMLAHG